jgi:hypothetical protein
MLYGPCTNSPETRATCVHWATLTAVYLTAYTHCDHALPCYAVLVVLLCPALYCCVLECTGLCCSMFAPIGLEFTTSAFLLCLCCIDHDNTVPHCAAVIAPPAHTAVCTVLQSTGLEAGLFCMWQGTHASLLILAHVWAATDTHAMCTCHAVHTLETAHREGDAHCRPPSWPLSCSCYILFHGFELCFYPRWDLAHSCASCAVRMGPVLPQKTSSGAAFAGYCWKGVMGEFVVGVHARVHTCSVKQAALASLFWQSAHLRYEACVHMQVTGCPLAALLPVCLPGTVCIYAYVHIVSVQGPSDCRPTNRRHHRTVPLIFTAV